MTVKELIDKLKTLPEQDELILFATGEGTKAKTIKGIVVQGTTGTRYGGNYIIS